MTQNEQTIEEYDADRRNLRLLDEYSKERLADTKAKILEFIQQQVEKRQTQGGLICISGGIDSALTAKLAIEALGKDRIYGLTLRYPGFNPEDFEDAVSYGQDLGIKHEVKNISRTLKSQKKLLKKVLDFKDPLNYLHLIQLVTSSISLLTARGLNYTVLCSGNRTEYLTGMFNLGGNVSDIFPLGDLAKSQVRNLARYCGVSEKIINKISRDGLVTSNPDEQRLGLPYAKVDKIVYCLEKAFPLDDIIELCEVNRETVMHFKERIANAKLRVSFPECKITPRLSNDEIKIREGKNREFELQAEIKKLKEDYARLERVNKLLRERETPKTKITESSSSGGGRAWAETSANPYSGGRGSRSGRGGG
jgi:NAD+ synthase